MSNPKSPQTYLVQLDGLFTDYLVKKAPSLPVGLKEAIVKFGPYIVLLFTLLALPAILALFGLGTLFMPFSFLGGLQAGFNFGLSMIVSFVTFVLGVLAIPGLFKRAKGAWNLLYYSTLLGVVNNVITFNIGGLVIGSLLSLYILFQIKEYYK